MPLDHPLPQVTASVATSIDDLELALRQYLGWVDDPLATLAGAVARDPDFGLGHALSGTLRLLSGEPGTSPGVREALQAAEKTAGRLTERERAHIAALRAWSQDEIRKAAAIWEAILIDHPRDAWALRFAHDTYFYLGDSANLRDSIARVLPAWPEDDPLHGFVLGMHAFGLEETGDFRRAELAGRSAVERNPADTWAVHAVAHVLEMEGRTLEGIGWLTELKPHWTSAPGLAVHQWWHLTLYLIERNRLDEVLAIYDTQIRGNKSGAILDLVDAAALLWRLQLIGVDIGDRWQELQQHWYAHLDEHVLFFNDAHIALVASGSRDDATLDRLERSLETYIGGKKSTNRDISAQTGRHILRAIRAFGAGDFATTVDELLPVRYDIRRIGGSHAQRDLFNQTLIAAAISAGRRNLAHALLAERRALKPASPRTQALYAEVAGG